MMGGKRMEGVAMAQVSDDALGAGPERGDA